MAKRRGNPNWGKPEPIGPVVPTVTSFEQVVKEFKLTPISCAFYTVARVGPAQQEFEVYPGGAARGLGF